MTRQVGQSSALISLMGPSHHKVDNVHIIVALKDNTDLCMHIQQFVQSCPHSALQCDTVWGPQSLPQFSRTLQNS